MTALDPYACQKRYRLRRDRFGALKVDVEPYRMQLLRWRAEGWSYPAIAQATCLSVDAVKQIAGNDTTSANQWVFRETASKIDNADFGRVHGAVKVPSLGARRRLQALCATGWTQSQIMAETGIARGTLNSALYRSDQIMAYTDCAIRDSYDRMAAKPPTGPMAERGRAHAARRGYAPPLAWDDIDDPDETPTGIRHIDRDRHVSRTEQITEMADQGYTLSDIVHRLDIQPKSIYITLHRAGATGDALWQRLQAREDRAA